MSNLQKIAIRKKPGIWQPQEKNNTDTKQKYIKKKEKKKKSGFDNVISCFKVSLSLWLWEGEGFQLFLPSHLFLHNHYNKQLSQWELAVTELFVHESSQFRHILLTEAERLPQCQALTVLE